MSGLFRVNIRLGNKPRHRKRQLVVCVHQWRRSYDVPPPAGECLKDTAERTIPFFTENILPLLEQGKNILISAHGNSLRSIVMHIEKLTKEQVLELEIPTGKPRFYKVEGNKITKQ